MAPGDFLDGDDSDNDFNMGPPSAAVENHAPGPDTPLTDTLVADNAQPATVVDVGSFSITCPAEIIFDWEELETSQLLYEMYGFFPPLPLPLPTQSSSLSDRDRSLLSTIVGLHQNDFNFFKSPAASFALEFMKLLGDSKTSKNSTWDIADGNRVSISSSGLFPNARD